MFIGDFELDFLQKTLLVCRCTAHFVILLRTRGNTQMQLKKAIPEKGGTIVAETK